MINDFFPHPQFVHAIRDLYGKICHTWILSRSVYETRRDFSPEKKEEKEVEMIENFSGNSFNVKSEKNKIEITSAKSNKVC